VKEPYSAMVARVAGRVSCSHINLASAAGCDLWSGSPFGGRHWCKLSSLLGKGV